MSCLQCRHAHDSLQSCAAFPAGIPFDVAAGFHSHETAIPGDNGIRFEPAADTREADNG